MNSSLLSTILAGMAAVLLPACVGFNQYKGIEPLSPLPPSHLARTQDALGRLKAPTGVPEVESLQPTFSWTAAGSGITKYDLAVCVGVRNISGVAYGPGAQVYYREGIEGTSHRLEQLLSPATVYVWSVRTRSGNVAGPWSTYNFTEFILVGGGYVSGENLWWPFITPGSTSNDVSGQQASAGLGRIYFYREKRFVGSAMDPHILLNGVTVGNSMNGGYFYVDRAPGDYQGGLRRRAEWTIRNQIHVGCRRDEVTSRRVSKAFT